MKLYEINDVYLSILELMADESTDMEMLGAALKNVNDELETKAENYAKIIKQIEGDIETVKKEKDRLASKQRSMENNVRWLKMNLQAAMELQDKRKFKTDLFSFNIQKNPKSVQVTCDPHLLDERFQSIKVDADKKAIKEALEAGETIEGATIVQSESLRIR